MCTFVIFKITDARIAFYLHQLCSAFSVGNVLPLTGFFARLTFVTDGELFSLLTDVVLSTPK